MTDGHERFVAPKEAVQEEQGTSGYIGALAWPGGRCKRRNMVT